MATMSISSSVGDISGYSSRMVTITVAATNQPFMRLANQTLAVPYNRLSQTMRNIHRNGGRVLNVSMASAAPATGAMEPAKPEDSKKKKK